MGWLDGIGGAVSGVWNATIGRAVTAVENLISPPAPEAKPTMAKDGVNLSGGATNWEVNTHASAGGAFAFDAPKIVGNNGGGIIAPNSSRIVGDNGGGIVSNNGANLIEQRDGKSISYDGIGDGPVVHSGEQTIWAGESVSHSGDTTHVSGKTVVQDSQGNDTYYPNGLDISNGTIHGDTAPMPQGRDIFGGSHIVGNNGGGIVSNNGANLIGNNGAGVVSNNGANLIGNNGAG